MMISEVSISGVQYFAPICPLSLPPLARFGFARLRPSLSGVSRCGLVRSDLVRSDLLGYALNRIARIGF